MHLPEDIFAKLRTRTLCAGRDVSHALGLDKQFFQKVRGSRILIYHGICQSDHTRFNPIFLTVKTFEEHLRFYIEYFNVISLDDFYQGKFSNDRFNICLTFDDGFANNHRYVLPLLEKYRVPATFFVTAIRNAGYDILWNDFLNIVSKYGPKAIWYKNEHYYKGRHDKYISTKTGMRLADKLRIAGFTEKAEMMEELGKLIPFKKNEPDTDYWLQMTEAQIRELAASPYANIGAHGYYHNDLSKINIANAALEMADAKSYLENITGSPIKSMAFPYGAYTRDVIAKARQAGYSQLLAMDFHTELDAQENALRERFTVNPFISTVNQMYATINRTYE